MPRALALPKQLTLTSTILWLSKMTRIPRLFGCSAKDPKNGSCRLVHTPWMRSTLTSCADGPSTLWQEKALRPYFSTDSATAYRAKLAGTCSRVQLKPQKSPQRFRRVRYGTPLVPTYCKVAQVWESVQKCLAQHWVAR